jgi:S-adenosylmethionine:tRNA ribosyltransferase-isomerase
VHNVFENLDLNDFDYDLPNEKIALYPLENRDSCKLLVFNNNRITHSKFNEIANFISNDSLLILNSTKVLPARILVNKLTGALIEFLLLEPKDKNIDYQIAVSATNSIEWKCIIGGKNIKIGDIFDINYQDIHFNIEILNRYENKADVKFSWHSSKLSFGEVLERIGKIPLPPYIKRDVIDNDKNDYQTIYANKQGSIAAPTAGLHFTEEVLSNIKDKNIKINELILHVGAGTFVPISTSISSHRMHPEKVQVSNKTIFNLLMQYVKNKSVIATGTTSLRTLESLYWFGVKLIKGKTNFETYKENYGFHIEQDEPYKNTHNISVNKSFEELLNFININKLDNIQGSTEIFIVPGYNIKTINGLLTNFHLPKSTLMLLVSAFLGTNNIKKIYQEALLTNYRFLSYGDVMLLLR